MGYLARERANCRICRPGSSDIQAGHDDANMAFGDMNACMGDAHGNPS